LIDYDSENVVKVAPVKGNVRSAGESHVI
jgi:hypothetical protein